MSDELNLSKEEWDSFDQALKECRGESLPEIRIYREVDSMNWTVERPDLSQRPTRTTSLEIAASMVVEAIRSLGGRAIVSYRDDNSLSARKARLEKE